MQSADGMPACREAVVAVDALDVWVRARVVELDAAVPIIET